MEGTPMSNDDHGDSSVSKLGKIGSQNWPHCWELRGFTPRLLNNILISKIINSIYNHNHIIMNYYFCGFTICRTDMTLWRCLLQLKQKYFEWTYVIIEFPFVGIPVYVIGIFITLKVIRLFIYLCNLKKVGPGVGCEG